MDKIEGFIQRIEALELLKKQKILLRQAYQNKIHPIEDLKKIFE